MLSPSGGGLAHSRGQVPCTSCNRAQGHLGIMRAHLALTTLMDSLTTIVIHILMRMRMRMLMLMIMLVLAFVFVPVRMIMLTLTLMLMEM